MKCEDLSGQGMQTAWLVEDVEHFAANPGSCSPRDRRLSYSLTHEEWLALFFDALGADRSGFDRWTTSHPDEAKFSTMGTLNGEIPDYPVLSRMQNDLDDVVFETPELSALRVECERAAALTSNPMALLGLKKLGCMIELAEESGMSVYLLGP